MNYSQEIEKIEKKVRTTMWITYNGASQAVERINGDNCQCGGCGNDGAIEDLLTLAKKMQEELIFLRSRFYGSNHDPNWIPCSERLPEESEFDLKEYWLTVKFSKDRGAIEDKVVSVLGRWGSYSKKFYDKNLIDFPSYFEVIAWMPLPEPFKGDAWK